MLGGKSLYTHHDSSYYLDQFICLLLVSISSFVEGGPGKELALQNCFEVYM